MPWCPKCGAEYRDSVAKCATCEMALVAEPPRSPEDPLALVVAVARRLFPRFARELRSQARRSVGYSVGGLRLLGRHPALLLIPLLIMLLGTYDTAMGRYALTHYLAQQESFADTQRSATPIHIPVGRILRLKLASHRTMAAVSELAGPLHYMTLQGTATILALSRPKEESLGEDRVPFQPAPALEIVFFLFGFAVSSFALGGFFGMVRQVGEEGSLSWRGFETNARRFWARFFLFQTVALVLLRWPGLWPWVAADSPWLANLSHAWGMWVAPAAAFFMALTWYAIITEDAGLWTALVRSAQTVGRHFVTGLCLLLTISLARFALLVPVEVSEAVLITRYGADDYSYVSLLGLPTLFLGRGVSAAVGVWFCLAAFLWYRDARLRTGTASEVG